MKNQINDISGRNIIQLDFVHSTRPDMFWGICLNEHSFRTIRLRMAWLFYLSSRFDPDSTALWALSGWEWLDIYEAVFVEKTIAVPCDKAPVSDAATITVHETSPWTFNISDDELTEFGKRERSNCIESDLEQVRCIILKHLTRLELLQEHNAVATLSLTNCLQRSDKLF